MSAGRNIPQELCQDIRSAYEWRSREALEAALERMVKCLSYAGPIPLQKLASDAQPGLDQNVTAG